MASLTEIRTRLLTQSVLLILAVVLGAGAGGWYAKSQPPTYTAQAFVVVVPQSDTDPIVAVKYAQAFGRIATQGAVLSEAAAAMRGSTSVDRVRSQVRASTSPDVPLIELTGSAKRPKEAADLANTVADALVKFGNDSRTRTKVRLASFVEATPPAGPSSPNPPLDVAVGAAAGLLIGGLAILAGVGARSSVRRREEEEAAGPPTPAASAEPEPHRGPGPDGGPAHEPQHRAREARAREARSYEARSYEAGSREARSHENRHGTGAARAGGQQP
jgi:capsular polysaccharide biosynthesis protein